MTLCQWARLVLWMGRGSAGVDRSVHLGWARVPAVFHTTR